MLPKAAHRSMCRDPQPDMKKVYTGGLHWVPSEIGNAMKRGTERLWESKGTEDTRRAWFSESTKQGTHEFTETEVAITGPAWVDRRSSA